MKKQNKIILWVLGVLTGIVLILSGLAWLGWRIERVEQGFAEPSFPYREYIKYKIPKKCKQLMLTDRDECLKAYAQYEDERRILCLEEYYLTENPNQNLKKLCQYPSDEWITKIPTRRTPEQTLALFIERLKADDIPGACEYINPLRRERECEFVRILKKDNELNQFIKQWKEARPIEELKEDSESFSYSYIYTNLEGESWTEFIGFVKDINGDWLIEHL